MRADLGWTYLIAGAMNTSTPPAIWPAPCSRRAWLRAARRRGRSSPAPRRPRCSSRRTASPLADPALYVFRFLSGLVSAVAFVAGGLLAAQPGGAAPADRGRRARAERRPGARHLLRRRRPRHRRLGAASCRCSPSGPWRMPGRAAGSGSGRSARSSPRWSRRRCALVRHAPTPRTAVPRRGAASRGSPGARFRPALTAYLMFGLGYIGYMTFIVALLREQGGRRNARSSPSTPCSAPRSRSRPGCGRGCCSAFAAAGR